MTTNRLKPTRFPLLLIAAVLLLGSFFGGMGIAGAQDAPCAGFTAEQGSTVYHDVVFGESFDFNLCLHNTPAVESATIKVVVDGFSQDFESTIPAPAQAKEGDLIHINYPIGLGQNLIPPFSTVEYVWTLNFKDGAEQADTLPTETFEYSDSRIAWSKVGSADGMVWVHSDPQSSPIAENAVTIIEETLPKIGELIPAESGNVDQQINVYLYPDHQTFQSALRLTGLDWVGGKASPEIGVIMLPLGGDGSLEAADIDLRQRLPHELTHLMVYRATGDGYPNFPGWLDEGLATIFEEFPNPNYAISLENVTDSTQLVPFSEMCVNLPVQPPEIALRGYAQSNGLVNHILTDPELGPGAIRAIVGAVAAGESCEQAIQTGLNTSADELAESWLTTRQPNFYGISPSVIVAALVVIGLSVVLLVIFSKRTDGSRTMSEFNG